MNKAEKYKVFYEKQLLSGIDQFQIDGKLNFDSKCYKFVEKIANSIKEQEKDAVEIVSLYYTQLFLFNDSVLFVSYLDDVYKMSTYTKKEFDDLAEMHRQWGEKLQKAAAQIQARADALKEKKID